MRSDEAARKQPGKTPEHRCDDAPAHDIIVIARVRHWHLEEGARLGQRIEPRKVQHQDQRGHTRNAPHMDGTAAILRPCNSKYRCEQDKRPHSQPRNDCFHDPDPFFTPGLRPRRCLPL